MQYQDDKGRIVINLCHDSDNSNDNDDNEKKKIVLYDCIEVIDTDDDSMYDDCMNDDADDAAIVREDCCNCNTVKSTTSTTYTGISNSGCSNTANDSCKGSNDHKQKKKQKTMISNQNQQYHPKETIENSFVRTNDTASTLVTSFQMEASMDATTTKYVAKLGNDTTIKSALCGGSIMSDVPIIKTTKTIVYINSLGNDNAIVTDGIMQLLHEYQQKQRQQQLQKQHPQPQPQPPPPPRPHQHNYHQQHQSINNNNDNNNDNHERINSSATNSKSSNIITLFFDSAANSCINKNSNNNNNNNNNDTINTHFQVQQEAQEQCRYLLTMQHIQQQEKWSCGYRNTQMILTQILPLLTKDHSYYCRPVDDNCCVIGKYFCINDDNYNYNYNYNDNANAKNIIINNRSTIRTSYVPSPIPKLMAPEPKPELKQKPKRYERHITCCIPSLHQIQVSLETCWKDGYDPKGALHYNYSIINTNKQIGAVEVSIYFTYIGIDSTIIQFMKRCSKSSTLLGPFCKEYFSRSFTRTDCASSATSRTAVPSTSMDIAQAVLRQIEHPQQHQQQQQQQQYQHLFAVPIEESRSASAIPLPLYLQWEGHSVTVIGVELNPSNGTVQHLLVLDPIRNGTSITNDLIRGIHNNTNKKQTNCTSNSHCLRQLRLRWDHLSQTKDCQIVLCTTNSISYQFQQSIQQNGVQSIIAAHDAVVRATSSKKTVL